jgi:hypothetical protein
MTSLSDLFFESGHNRTLQAVSIELELGQRHKVFSDLRIAKVE